jgi:hypothetical protein
VTFGRPLSVPAGNLKKLRAVPARRTRKFESQAAGPARGHQRAAVRGHNFKEKSGYFVVK